jgi:ABC-type ATPase involved in cell division
LSPALLLLDEPTTNMDEEARQQSFFLIRRLVSEGTGVVIASHDRQIIGQLGDRHVNLADGRLVAVEKSTRSAPARGADVPVHSAAKAP